MSAKTPPTAAELQAYALKIKLLLDTNGTTALMNDAILWDSTAARNLMAVEVGLIIFASQGFGWAPERTGLFIKVSVLTVLAAAAQLSYEETHPDTLRSTTERKIAEAMNTPVQGKVS